MSALFRDDIDIPHITLLEGLQHSLTTKIERPERLTAAAYGALTPPKRKRYDEDRAKYVTGGIRVKTPLGEETLMLYRQIRRGNLYAPNRTGLIIDGAGHMGKTTLCQYLMQWTYDKYMEEHPYGVRDGDVPVVYIEARPRSSGRALLTAFAEFFGLVIPTAYKTDHILTTVVQVMQKKRTQLVVIDEFQNIAARNPGNGETVDYIKELTNAVKATFVISGIHVLSSDILAGVRGNQLASRFIQQELRPYSIANDELKLRWSQLLINYERELLLLAQKPKSILAHANELHEATHGSIGALAKLLTRTTVDLIFDADADMEHFDASSFSSQRRDITSESVIYEGGNIAA
ncbi:TniB family NTP-binding protein [Leifsonia soli]|uniref:GTPase SAR1 family protein n=1 Tax=Leifsonia soli TaxID=582665 RepID=A0A852T582_9MICO|nr:GTPase SAR1 family protein [Leifsonia soli]